MTRPSSGCSDWSWHCFTRNSDSTPYLGNLGETPNYSEAMSRSIDQEISQILDVAYQLLAAT
jgi:ATP-dependent Zn protease